MVPPGLCGFKLFREVDVSGVETLAVYMLGSCTGRASARGPGLNDILRAGPGKGLKRAGPGRARAGK